MESGRLAVNSDVLVRRAVNEWYITAGLDFGCYLHVIGVQSMFQEKVAHLWRKIQFTKNSGLNCGSIC